jgi:tetratricopeptide (TPR) repeat protein
MRPNEVLPESHIFVNFFQVEVLYTVALQINPNDAEALRNHGKAYITDESEYSLKGGYDRAVADFTAALRINPNDTVAIFNRAYACGIKGDYDRAIADYI